MQVIKCSGRICKNTRIAPNAVGRLEHFLLPRESAIERLIYIIDIGTGDNVIRVFWIHANAWFFRVADVINHDIGELRECILIAERDEQEKDVLHCYMINGGR